MIKLKKYFALLLMLILVFSCFRGAEKNREVLARVNNTFLYADEIETMIPSGITGNDSVELLRVYVGKWVEQQLILQNANNILTAKEKDFSKKIRDYRNALLIIEWEKKLLSAQLDTNITEKQLKDYYEANQREFILQADIVRVLYIKLNANSPFVREARDFLLDDPFDSEAAEQFCRKYAVNHFLDIRSWLYVDDIQKEIPLTTQHKTEMSTGNGFFEIQDAEYMYMIKVLDSKLKGSVSPMALEENTIKEVILQKRKKEIIDNHVRELRSSAERSSKIEIYEYRSD